VTRKACKRPTIGVERTYCARETGTRRAVADKLVRLTPIPAAAFASLLALQGLACKHDQPQLLRPAPAASVRHPVEIHQPSKLRSIETGRADASGKPLRVACVTCHTLRESRAELPVQASELREFHRGLSLEHGDLRCGSCHQPGRHDALRLADGRTIAMADALTLCSQCHGPQRKRYDHGSHGGMSGYWDLRRGPRLRNHCVDCHDPHAPAFAPARPVLMPHDRYLSPADPHAEREPSAQHAPRPGHG
jgi:formate-dependent nitrite reductase cytochrome c552 subunit